MQITSYLKCWSNKNIFEAKLTIIKDKKRLGRNKDLRKNFK